MSFTTFSTINSIPEIAFIAGTDYTIEFTVYDATTGSPADLGAATCSWKMSPYGKESVITLSKSGSVTGTSTFEVHLVAADTLSLSGIYVHQPLVIEGGKDYRSQQGIINISPAIN